VAELRRAAEVAGDALGSHGIGLKPVVRFGDVVKPTGGLGEMTFRPRGVIEPLLG
jgi:hypothetical protein